jgi:uncharacterized cupredoxin-like copper-binding protein
VVENRSHTEGIALRKRVVLTLCALMIGTLSLAGCGAREMAGAAASAASRKGLQAGSMVQVKRQTIEVRAKEYHFTPALITVDKGTRVTIRLINEGTEQHEFELDAFDFEIKPIAPRTRAQASFTADRTGLFEFACHVDGHYEKGMVGFLRVQ